MNPVVTLRKLLTAPLPAVTLYVGVMILLLFLVASSLSDIFSKRADVAASATMLEQFEGRRPAAVRAQAPDGAGPAGSPFLEGATVTVAGAALLQRVTAAVTKLGGNVLSSQVDVQDAKTKAGLVSLVASCEVTQEDLQKLLYDIEAGMPYLFVDQISVQAPDTVTRGEGGRLRVMIGVSGQWEGGGK